MIDFFFLTEVELTGLKVEKNAMIVFSQAPHLLSQ